MKRLLIILLSFIPVCAMQAQTKAEKIEDIRQQYALAKEKVSKNGKKKSQQTIGVGAKQQRR